MALAGLGRGYRLRALFGGTVDQHEVRLAYPLIASRLQAAASTVVRPPGGHSADRTRRPGTTAPAGPAPSPRPAPHDPVPGLRPGRRAQRPQPVQRRRPSPVQHAARPSAHATPSSRRTGSRRPSSTTSGCPVSIPADRASTYVGRCSGGAASSCARVRHPGQHEQRVHPAVERALDVRVQPVPDHQRPLAPRSAGSSPGASAAAASPRPAAPRPSRSVRPPRPRRCPARCPGRSGIVRSVLDANHGTPRAIA